METEQKNRIARNLIFFALGVIFAVVVCYFGIPRAEAQTLNNAAVANSASESNANSASQSGSIANSNQTLSSNLGANQGNAQNITFNTEQRERTQLDTNTAVPLAAAVSFSSDYCGGVGSAGASAAGISIGVAKPILDGNCQSLRRAEKFGVMAVTARNMGSHTTAARLLAMAVWELCTAEANSSASRNHKRGADGTPSTQSGCLKVNLVTPETMPADDSAPSQKLIDDASRDATPSTQITPPPTTSAPVDKAKKQKDEEQRKANDAQHPAPPLAMQWSPPRL